MIKYDESNTGNVNLDALRMQKTPCDFDSTAINTDTLLHDSKIEMNNDVSRVYAFTDKIGGFWQGQTFGYNFYDGGFNKNNQKVLLDSVIFTNGSFRDRSQAEKSTLYPHQINHYYKNPDITESMMLLSGKSSIITTFSCSTTINELKYVPCFIKDRKNLSVSQSTDKKVLFYNDNQSNAMVALFATRNFIWDSGTSTLSGIPEPYAKDNRVMGSLQIKAPGDCKIVAVFGSDKTALEQQILEISNNLQVLIDEKKQNQGNLLKQSYVKTNDPNFDRALSNAKVAGDNLVVSQFGKGIWAGLPWFNQNWGRDTFISLPGISLVTGQFDDAKQIIKTFTDYQNTDENSNLYGRIPNRVNSPTDIIYNTADGTPWLIRELAEYTNYTGDMAFASELYPVIQKAIAGTVKNHTDSEGFLKHDDADSWMDARINGGIAWSPRGNRAVEIQALWYTQLIESQRLATILGHSEDAAEWKELAQKVAFNFNKKFVHQDGNALFDHLDMSENGDTRIRPNQIFAISAPLSKDLVTPQLQSGILKQVLSELTYPHGVATLYQNDPYFHPYHHDQIYHYDAAYHNGLCWQWLTGPVISSMVKYGAQDKAYELTAGLTDQMIYQGMPGSLSELALPIPEANGKINLSGTYSQAWSIAEYIRNFYQDYLGITPNMLEREITFRPALPKNLSRVQSIVPIGNNEKLSINIDVGTGKYIVEGIKLINSININFQTKNQQSQVYQLKIPLKNTEKVIIERSDTQTMNILVNGQVHQREDSGALYVPIPDLHFQTPVLRKDLNSLKIKDYLQNILQNQ